MEGNYDMVGNKDGTMCYRHNANQPVYAPNSYGGPRADPQRYRDPSWFVEAAEIVRTAYMAHKDHNDFIQPGTLYRQVMSPTDRDHLASNIVRHLSQRVGQQARGDRSAMRQSLLRSWMKQPADKI